MARTVTTESIKSSNQVLGSYDVYDFLFLLIYTMFAYILRTYVHPSMRVAYMIFSILIAVFLVSKSTLNKKRKNYESIFFYLSKDISVYRPYVKKGEL